MILGIELEKNRESLSYINEVKRRLISNPFLKGGVYEPSDGFFIFYSNPLIPSLHILGLVLLFAMLYLNGMVLTWYVWIPLSFIFVSYFWSAAWHKIVIRIGLRRKGFKGKMKFSTSEDTLRRLIDID